MRTYIFTNTKNTAQSVSIDAEDFSDALNFLGHSISCEYKTDNFDEDDWLLTKGPSSFTFLHRFQPGRALTIYAEDEQSALYQLEVDYDQNPDVWILDNHPDVLEFFGLQE